MKKRVKARREPDADAAAAVRPAHALVPPHHQTADMPVAADTLGPAVTMGRGADSGADSGLDAGLDASLDASLDAGPEGALSPAAAARADQIRHMRHQRRAAIKESNFLKNMR